MSKLTDVPVGSLIVSRSGRGTAWVTCAVLSKTILSGVTRRRRWRNRRSGQMVKTVVSVSRTASSPVASRPVARDE
jgi:hypothetical protein